MSLKIIFSNNKYIGSTAGRAPLKNLWHLFSIKPQAPLLVMPSDGAGTCEVWDLASQVMCAPHVHWIHERQLYQAAGSTAGRTPLKNLWHLFSIKPRAPLLVMPHWRIYDICFQGDLHHTEIKYNNQPKRIFWMNYQFFLINYILMHVIKNYIFSNNKYMYIFWNFNIFFKIRLHCWQSTSEKSVTSVFN